MFAEEDIELETEPRRLGELFLELLSEFHRGRPLADAARMLSHASRNVREAAAWVISELGARATPILPFAPAMLSDDSDSVRVCAVDFVLCCAGANDGDILASAIARLDDPQKGVRLNAMAFLVRADKEQLGAALDWIRLRSPNVPFARGLEMLLSKDAWATVSRLSAADAVTRRFVVPIAIRCGRSPDEISRLVTELADEDAAAFFTYATRAGIAAPAP